MGEAKTKVHHPTPGGQEGRTCTSPPAKEKAEPVEIVEEARFDGWRGSYSHDPGRRRMRDPANPRASQLQAIPAL